MMYDLINLQSYRSILCLKGELPSLSFFETVNLPIIAADGAANNLAKLRIAPQLIIGDLDSVHPELLASYASLHLPDQNQSDYQKALYYLKNNHLLPAIVVGINGGHLDHVLNNINLFMESNCLLYAPPIIGLVLTEKSIMQFALPVQTKISFMGIPQARLSSKGLKWELEDTELLFPGKTSCFNRTHLPEITLEVHQGAVLILIYEQRIEDAALQ